MTPIDSSYVSEFSEQEAKKKSWSVLDLCAYDAFTLLIDRAVAESWKAVLGGVREHLPEKLKINVAVLDQDFEIQAGERGSEWLKAMLLDSGGGILVRPDQHILALMEKAEESVMVGALKEHLGLPI